jgi:ribosome biogenesis SPOUT family RNA methylase Rps3
LFTTFDGLNLGDGQPQWRKYKLASAKTIIAKVRQLERDGLLIPAESEVKKLIPSA